MIPAHLAGAAILAIPAIIMAWAVLWRRQRPVFWFAVALIVVGVGYLTATGATEDIARRLVPQLSNPPPVRAK